MKEHVSNTPDKSQSETDMKETKKPKEAPLSDQDKRDLQDNEAADTILYQGSMLKGKRSTICLPSRKPLI